MVFNFVLSGLCLFVCISRHFSYFPHHSLNQMFICCLAVRFYGRWSLSMKLAKLYMGRWVLTLYLWQGVTSGNLGGLIWYTLVRGHFVNRNSWLFFDSIICTPQSCDFKEDFSFLPFLQSNSDVLEDSFKSPEWTKKRWPGSRTCGEVDLCSFFLLWNLQIPNVFIVAKAGCWAIDIWGMAEVILI